MHHMSNAVTLKDLVARLKSVEKRKKAATSQLNDINNNLKTISKKKTTILSVIHKYDEQLALIRRDIDDITDSSK